MITTAYEESGDFSDPRARCYASGHELRIATHYTQHGHFCTECAERIKLIMYGGGLSDDMPRPFPDVFRR